MKLRDKLADSIRLSAVALLLAGVATSLPLGAQEPTVAPFSSVERTASQPRVQFAAATRGAPILPGSDILVSGNGFHPGQHVQLLHGTTSLTQGQLKANEKGEISARFTLPKYAVPGTYPLVVTSGQPYQAFTTSLKISPDLPVFGKENYRISKVEVARGLYQSAYGRKAGALFATSAVGRPPVMQSELVKLDATSLKVLMRITPAEVAEGEGVFAVYGVGVDDANGTVWTSNSRQGSVAIYRQADLALVKQFPAGTVPHARDIVVDEAAGKVYVSSITNPHVYVFDTNGPAASGRITIMSNQRGARFSAASLSLDTAANRLYVVSQTTNEVAVINTAAGKVEHIFPVPGAVQAIGIAHDSDSGRLYIAAQGSDNLIVLDGVDGKLVADTPVGAGALNVVFDPVTRHAYVANRGAGTIAVTDADGRLIANMDGVPFANHVSLGEKGVVYSVDKSANITGKEKDVLLRIKPRR